MVAKHLELVQNSKDPRSHNSLYGIMNHTKTPGGGMLSIKEECALIKLHSYSMCALS